MKTAEFHEKKCEAIQKRRLTILIKNFGENRLKIPFHSLSGLAVHTPHILLSIYIFPISFPFESTASMRDFKINLLCQAFSVHLQLGQIIF